MRLRKAPGVCADELGEEADPLANEARGFVIGVEAGDILERGGIGFGVAGGFEEFLDPTVVEDAVQGIFPGELNLSGG